MTRVVAIAPRPHRADMDADRLRAWFAALPDDDVITILRACPALQEKAARPDRNGLSSRAERRAVERVRRHVSGLSDSGLGMLATRLLGAARRDLVGMGFTTAAVHDPDSDQLRAQLLALPRPIAVMALFGLLLGRGPHSELARGFEAGMTAVPGLSPDEGGTVPDERPTVDTDPPTWTDVDVQLRRLEDGSARLAALLDQDAECVAAGRQIADAGATAERLVEYATTIDALLAAVRQLAPAAEPAVDLVGVRAAHEEHRRKSTERQERLAGLRDERLQIVELLAASPSRRTRYEELLADIDRELAELGEPGEPLGTISIVDTAPVPPSGDVPREPDRSAGTPDGGRAENEIPPAPDLETETEPETEPVARADEILTDTADDATPTTPSGDEPPVPPVPPEPSPAADVTPPAPDEPAAIDPPATDVVVPAPVVETEPAEPDGGDTAERAAFPWESGAPPLVVDLVRQGRFVEAYWVTAASDESPTRAEVLRLAAAAFDSVDSLGAGDVQVRWTPPEDTVGGDHEASLVAAAAILRCGLSAGYSSHYLAVDAVCTNLPVEWANLLRSASTAVQLNHRVDSHADADLQGSDPVRERAELERVVRRLRDELPVRRIKYHRATQVQRWLVQPRQPLGAVLEAILAWAGGTGDIAAVRAGVERLAGDGGVQVIQEADAALHGLQKRQPIVAGALDRLQATIREVLDRGREAITIAERMDGTRAGATEAGRALQQAAHAAAPCATPPGVGGAVLRHLLEWLLASASRPACRMPTARAGSPADAMPEDVLLVLPDLPRDEQRNVDVSSPHSRLQLMALAGEHDPVAAVRTYLDRGAVDLAERLTDLMAAASLPDAEAARLELKESRARWEQRVRQQRAEVEDQLARLRIQDLLSAEDVSTFTPRAADTGHEEAGAFDRAVGELTRIGDRLQCQLDKRVRVLREQAGQAQDPALRKKVDDLLDAGDTIIANELLALDRDGKAIPDRPTDATEELAAFLAIVADVSVPHVSVPHVSVPHFSATDARGWADVFRQHDAPPFAESTTIGLDAWAALESGWRSGAVEYGRNVISVLRLLGLDTDPGSLSPKKLSRLGVRAFEVSATPRDASYVPELGSEAHGRYRVLVILDDRPGRSPLADVDTSSVDRPHIVLHLRPMTQQVRAQVAEEARASRANVVVVDPPVVGWVGARAPGSFRATQRLVLPWSGYVPYRPAGRVPPEVFVGRERERQAVVAPNGGIFVYGGRQLGKSALLRQIEADPGADRVAIYLDLKARSIGEAESPEQIWAAIAGELKSRGVFSEKVSQQPDPDVVVRQIERWLAGEEHRYLLVLADESDAFLTADAQGVPTQGGVNHFPNMLRLKQLMESSHRRFKIVFAGLHQVQRFRHLSNVPIPHGGEEILIGPLDPRSATKLVVEPMAALGYRFERVEVVWRLLAATNYQPAPTQIFCVELLKHLRGRARRSDPMPVTITARDVDTVATDGDVRDRIAGLARITIDLEDRYRVLTLLIASKSLDDRFSRAYPVVELLDEAHAAWREGFAAIDESALDVYLREMEGLGLLTRHRDGSGYSVRSPNVVSMLGTREQFERELLGSAFTLPYEYNPRYARRLLGVVDGIEQRSPLTDTELERLVGMARAGAVPIVVGSEWLTIDRLPDALRRFLTGRGETVIEAGPADLKRRTTEASRQKGTWIVVDLRGAGPDELRDTITECRGVPKAPAVAMLGPAEAAALSADQRATLVRPLRWTVDSIRAWHECPFETPELRWRLIAATGGWPKFVERVIAQAKRHDVTCERAIETALGLPNDREQALAVLNQIGIDESSATVIARWAQVTRVVDGRVEELSPEDVGLVPGGVAG